MKPLAQMTRDEIWALDDYEIISLLQRNRYALKTVLGYFDVTYDRDKLLTKVETAMLELQQDSTDARRESLEDR